MVGPKIRTLAVCRNLTLTKEPVFQQTNHKKAHNVKISEVSKLFEKPRFSRRALTAVAEIGD